MKTEKSLSKSADAAIKQTIKEAELFLDDLYDCQFANNQKELGESMPRARDRLSIITQRLHEFNAYKNALET